MKDSRSPANRWTLQRKGNTIELPEFKSYEEEAAFWDNLDTADMMEDDGEWFHFSTSRLLRADQEG